MNLPDLSFKTLSDVLLCVVLSESIVMMYHGIKLVRTDLEIRKDVHKDQLLRHKKLEKEFAEAFEKI